jgi:hypothetical protein
VQTILDRDGLRQQLGMSQQHPQVFAAGQAVALPDRAIHNEGATAAGPLKLIAIYIVEKGQPLVQPVK